MSLAGSPKFLFTISPSVEALVHAFMLESNGTVPESAVLSSNVKFLMMSESWDFTSLDSRGCRTFPWNKDIREYPSAPILFTLFSMHQSSASTSKSNPTAVRRGSLRSHSVLSNTQNIYVHSSGLYLTLQSSSSLQIASLKRWYFLHYFKKKARKHKLFTLIPN